MNPAFRAGPPSPAPDRAAAPGRSPAGPARAVMAASTPAAAPANGKNLRCHRCGEGPADPLQQILMSAIWLVPGPDGPTTACYCRACTPSAGPITDLTCQLCGDGPLLVGDLAADPDATSDDALPPAAQHWLTAAGWRLDGPVCPDCRPRL